MKTYWDKYYNKLLPPVKPTSFAIYCKKFLKKYKNTLLDIGCGNGRDTIYFNKLKIDCYGLDKSKQAIRILKNKNKKIAGKFINSDFSKFNYSKLKKKISIYSRFSIHSINKEKELNFFKKINKSNNLEYLFVEVRTIYDELYGVGKKLKKNEYLTSHYRRFIDPKIFKKQIKKKFSIKLFKISRNFAKYKDENPLVLRIIAKRK